MQTNSILSRLGCFLMLFAIGMPLAVSRADEALAVAPVYGDHMVLQREMKLPTFAGGGEGWGIVQEAQAGAVGDVPNAGYIDIRDQPDGGLHPKNKKPVGERLAALAMEKFVK